MCVCVRVYVCVCTINRGIECDCVRESCGVKVYLTKQWGGSVIPTGGMVVLVLGGSGGGGGGGGGGWYCCTAVRLYWCWVVLVVGSTGWQG